MIGEHILYEEKAGIAEITINRPEKRNAFTPQMFADLQTCWDQFAQGQARVAILKSCDDAVFSAGADLNDPPQEFWRSVPEFGMHCDKPIIAALSGKTIGVGLALALMCDFIVMSEDATLIYPEAKIGVSKGAISAVMRRAPFRLALEMIVMGDPIPAQRAFETGMINKITAPGHHVEEARQMATTIAGNAPLVVEMLKRMCLEAVGDTPVQTYFKTLTHTNRVGESADAANALIAFREKRKPVFEGK